MYERMVYITGMPRSGTTWVSQMVASHPLVRLKFCPLFSYEFKAQCSPSSTPDEWRALFRAVYNTQGRFLDQEHLRDHGYVPELHPVDTPPVLAIKSNRFHDCTRPMVDALPEVTWLVMVRDPVTTMASWVGNPTEFGSEDTVQQAWRTGGSRKSGVGEFWGFDDWKAVTADHVALAAQYPDRVHLLPYEDLAPDPIRAARTVLSCAGLEPHPAVFSFARDSQSRHTGDNRSVFKDPRRTRSTYRALPPDIVDTIVAETRAAGLGRFLRPGPVP